MIRRKPMKRRIRPGDDQDYLRWIRTLPCAAMNMWDGMYDWKQSAPCEAKVEAHHAGPRGFGRRASDRTAVPLCAYHHRLGPHAAHVLGKNFWQHHGIDRDTLIAELNARYEREKSS